MFRVDWDLEPSYTAHTSFDAVYSDGHATPAGVTMANGRSGIIPISVFAWVRGRGGSRTVSLTFANRTTGNVTVPAASGPTGNTGWLELDEQILLGEGSFRFQINTGGSSVYFGRSSEGGTSHTGGVSYPGKLAGGMQYITAPTAPRNLSGSASTTAADTINFTWDPPANGGWSTVFGYNLYRNGVLYRELGPETEASVSVPAGTSYSWTVRARNRVTEAAGTQSVSSNAVSVAAQGVPSAPRSLTGNSDSTRVGATRFRWSTPSDTAGGISRYLVYRNGSLISSSVSQTQINDPNYYFIDTGLTQGQSYSYEVRAQNAWGVTSGVRSAPSNSISLVASELPSAPRNLTATVPVGSLGEIQLSWLAPLDDGTSTVTGYQVRTSANGTIIATLGNVTSYTITGLTPGTTYTYVVRAITGLSAASGSTTPYSASASATPTGDPAKPTGLTVNTDVRVAYRLVVDWSPITGPVTGYRVYDSSVEVIDVPATVTSYTFDNLSSGTHTYTVRAYNTLANGTENLGPTSTAVARAPRTYSAQALSTARTVSNPTAASFGGTRTLTGATATTLSYASPGADLASTAVGSGTGGITNLTNQDLNGTYTAIVGGSQATERTMRYARTTTAFAPRPVTSGSVINATNSALNGSATVTSADTLNKTVSYSRVTPDIPTRLVSGTVTNRSNVIYNVTDVPVTSASDISLSYAKVSGNLPLTGASGTITNRTLRDYYNGTHRVTDVPSFDKFVFKSGFGTGSDETVIHNVAENQTMPVVGSLDYWSPNAGTTFTGVVGSGTLSRTATGTASVVFPAYPDGSVYEQSSVNLTAGFTARIPESQADPDIPIQVYAIYQTLTGEVIQTLDPQTISADDRQISFTVPGTQNGPRELVLYFTGLVPNEDEILISKPFLVATAIDNLPFQGPYFDGDTTDTYGAVYAWTTSPHSSSRTLQATPTFSSVAVDPAFPGASATESQGSLLLKYRSGWIG